MNHLSLRPDQRVAALIDGPALYATSRKLGWDVDFKKLLAFLNSNCILHRAIYFTAFSEGEEFTPIKPLVDWLSYNGYRIVSKPVREYFDDSGRRRVRAHVHVEMAVEMLNLTQFVEHFLVFSGDGELAYAVDAAQERGARVSVVSSMKADQSVSDELRRVADAFVELEDLRETFGKPVPAPRRDIPEADGAVVEPRRPRRTT